MGRSPQVFVRPVSMAEGQRLQRIGRTARDPVARCCPRDLGLPFSTWSLSKLANTPRLPAPGSWPWRRAALLASVAAQLITVAALNSADPIPATWAALLLAVAPVPLALAAAFAPSPAARLAAPVTVVVLVVGIIGQVTHAGLFFLPALAAMAVATLRLWQE